MNIIKSKGPLVDSGICRCCGSTKKCRILNVCYDFEDTKEVYSEMIMDSLGLTLSHIDGKVNERLICATCVVRLRDSAGFKRQVLKCEEAFLQMKIYDSESKTIEVPIVKEEVKEFEDDGRGLSPVDDHYDTLGSPLKSDPSESEDNEPLKKLQLSKKKTKIKKKQKIVKKLKILKENTEKLHPLVREKVLQRKRTIEILRRQKAIERQKLILKLELSKEADKSPMILHNITTLIENSFVCPFRCRHSNLHCYYCRQQFTEPADLRRHNEMHSPKKFTITEYRTTVKIDITRIDCRLCDEKIETLNQFNCHIVNNHHKILYNEVPEFVLPFKLDKENMHCVICDKSFMYFHAINQHMNEHYSNCVCETCGLGFVDESRLIAHKPKHEIGSFPCEECGKLFKNEMYKELHVDRVHKKLGKVYCPKCDVRLMSYYQKLKHLVEVHGEQPLQLACTSCDKVFECRRYLTLHLRKYHVKDFRYECEYCGQKFFTRFSLKNHLPTHTGERNFKCKICEKSYPRLKTLKEHTRIHTNDRRYRCHICGQAFIQNCSLKGHLRSQHPEYG